MIAARLIQHPNPREPGSGTAAEFSAVAFWKSVKFVLPPRGSPILSVNCNPNSKKKPSAAVSVGIVTASDMLLRFNVVTTGLKAVNAENLLVPLAVPSGIVSDPKLIVGLVADTEVTVTPPDGSGPVPPHRATSLAAL